MEYNFTNAFFECLRNEFSRSEASLEEILESFDTSGKLHCTNGPAFETIDHGIWAVHGEIYTTLEDYVQAAGLAEDEAIMLSLRFSGCLPTRESRKFAIGQ